MARLAIEVSEVAGADARFQALVRAHHGDVDQDEVSLGDRESTATIVARVPDGELDALLDQAGTVGVLLARDVRMRDVGKEYFDAEILERNLVEEIARVEELLQRATSIADVLGIEQHLESLRTRLDQVRGELRYMKDQVERAVVSARLTAAGVEVEVIRPNVDVFPNVRGVVSFDWRGAGSPHGYAGGGASFTFPSLLGAPMGRGFSVEADVLTAATGPEPAGGPTVFFLTLGTDSYSDFLGGGRRTVLDPFVGWRVGYAGTGASGEAALGLIVGVDLVKTAAVLVPLRAEVLGMARGAGGPHAAVLPSLGVSVAF